MVIVNVMFQVASTDPGHLQQDVLQTGRPDPGRDRHWAGSDTYLPGRESRTETLSDKLADRPHWGDFGLTRAEDDYHGIETLYLCHVPQS